jgi:mannose-6-phosphate isomerase
MQPLNNEIGKIYQRPWGSYQTLALSPGYQVKVIIVQPNGRLSLQKHFKRAEHWVIVSGSPTVTVGEKTAVYRVNQSVYIPQESKHRIENLTHEVCTLIEVQIGDYLGEDDIVRFEDIYGRDSHAR